MSLSRATTVLALTFVFLSPSLFAQGAPINGTARVTLSASSSQIAVGFQTTLQVGVDLTGVTGQNSSGGRTAAVLGGYTITVTFDVSRVNFVSAAAGSTPEFPQPTANSSPNTNGVLKITSFQTSPSGPTGVISVAALTFRAVAPGTTTVTASAPLAGDLSTTVQNGAGPAGINSTPASTNLTIGTAPTAVTLDSPANGATNVAEPVTLTWSGGTGADTFDVYFGTDADPAFLQTVSGSPLQVTTIPGTTFYWQVIARNAFGQTQSSIGQFRTAGVAPCATPATTTASLNRTEAQAGESYVLSWTSAKDATEYRIEESTTANFSSPVTSSQTTLQLTLSHNPAADTRYYYRLFGRNKTDACDLVGAASNVVSILVHAPKSTSETFYIPVVGSTAGNLGSFFKTALQLHNPSGDVISGKIVYHAQGVSGSSSDPSLSYSLRAGEAITYADLLPAMGQSGLGSAELITAAGRAPVAVIRIFNDAGVNGTSGMTENLVAGNAALQTGESATLIAPPDPVASRFNIGVRSLEAGATLNVGWKDKSGVVRKNLTKTYGPTFFAQVTSLIFLEGTIAPSDTITFTVTNGQAVIYGATTDNTTQDPSLQLSAR
ncbi:MAG TPA: hypothetical protein VHL58_06515 [Thermoanaerobaculia bacterium]|nr:hypothetical protein [Thermoanaerobaculia bacterium]